MICFSALRSLWELIQGRESLLVVGRVLQKPPNPCLPQHESIAMEMIAEIPDSTSLTSQQGLVKGEAKLTRGNTIYQNSRWSVALKERVIVHIKIKNAWTSFVGYAAAYFLCSIAWRKVRIWNFISFNSLLLKSQQFPWIAFVSYWNKKQADSN